MSFFARISYLMCWEGEKFFRRDTFEQLSNTLKKKVHFHTMLQEKEIGKRFALNYNFLYDRCIINT